MASLPENMDAYRPALRGRKHMVSAGHYLAAQAGFQVLEAGGNAIDAGVAAGLALGVVQSDLVNVAGVAPIILYLAETRDVVTISGLGRWPRAASAEVFRTRHGGGVPAGILRTVVPAAPDAWITALRRYGSMTFAEAAGPAIALARDGFAMYPLMAALIAAHADDYRRWPANAEIYLPGGTPPAVGDLFVQADLARSLQYMADEETAAGGDRDAGLAAARDAFYRGDIAQTITRYHTRNGGWLTAADMADFRVGVEPSVRIGFGGAQVHACGPWCQGPVLLQLLRLLEGDDLKALGHNSTAYIHTLTEAIKLAMADRERFYGDPEFVPVPIETLLSPAYAGKRRALIRDDVAWAGMPPAGDGTDWPDLSVGDAAMTALDTSYVCVVDGAGNAFSTTPSDTAYDAPVVPGTGLCPSSRGSQSRVDADHPAGVAPGRRPRLTPCPALAVTADGGVMPFGTPGADVQCQAMLQAFLNVTVFGMNPQAAVEAPRFASYGFPGSFAPHTYLPGRLNLEGRISEATVAGLRRLGHDVCRWDDWEWRAGAVCLIDGKPDGPRTAGADPRRACYALGW